MPASISAPMSSTSTYLTAASSSTSPGSRPARRAAAVDLLADAGGVLAHPGRVQARHTTPAWRPVTPPSRRWEKNRSSPAQIVQSPVSWISSTPGLGEPVARDRREVEVALADPGARDAGERGLDVLARPRSSSRARPVRSRRSARPVGAELAQRGDALGRRCRPPARASRRAAPRPLRRRLRAPAGSRRRTRARLRRAARSPGRPPRPPAGRARAARSRAGRARRGPGCRR